jgi:hypothetical protein
MPGLDPGIHQDRKAGQKARPFYLSEDKCIFPHGLPMWRRQIEISGVDSRKERFVVIPALCHRFR